MAFPEHRTALLWSAAACVLAGSVLFVAYKVIWPKPPFFSPVNQNLRFGVTNDMSFAVRPAGDESDAQADAADAVSKLWVGKKADATLTLPGGEEVHAQASVTKENGQVRIAIDPNTVSNLRPGKLHLKADLCVNQRTVPFEQDFLWGVLAMNPDKTVYKTGETAEISIGVLDDKGQIVCDADVELSITDPSGNVTKRSTKAGSIAVSNKCHVKDIFTEPDYVASYTPAIPGTYELNLTATIENGTRTVTDQFQVEDAPRYTVRRVGPTRVFPVKYQPMSLEIAVYEDFDGDIVERLPAAFLVDAPGATEVRNAATSIEVVWHRSIRKGAV